jgi:hypothetical protein
MGQAGCWDGGMGGAAWARPNGPDSGLPPMSVSGGGEHGLRRFVWLARRMIFHIIETALGISLKTSPISKVFRTHLGAGGAQA